MEKIFVTLLLSILPLNNMSHPHEEDPYTTYSFVSVGASENQSIGGVTDDYSWVLKIKSDTGLID